MSEPPLAFNQYNLKQFERTIRLTRLAIAKLEREQREVTLSAVAEVTRAVDSERNGKGITAATILRNPKARELFHEHSPAYQERQRLSARAKRKRSRRPTADVRAAYRGLRASDLIGLVEDLKQTVTRLQAEHVQLQTQRDEAYRQRDEALQQNARQLAALTQLRSKAVATRSKPRDRPSSAA
jgi:hypothetical protein